MTAFVVDGTSVLTPNSPLNFTDTNTQATPAHQHASYYFKDDSPLIIFLVENQLFKVHRHFLSGGSEVFHDMFTCPVEEGTGPEGMNNERPIHLPGVRVREFEALLDYFYQPPHLKVRYSKEQNLQSSFHLLSIAHRFCFDEIFQYALGELQSVIKDIPAIERFSIGQKYNLTEWMLSAYETLLDRVIPLTAHEAEILGPHKVVSYIYAREAMHEANLQAELERERVKHEPLNLSARFGSTHYVQPLPVASVPPCSTRSFVEEFF